MRDNKVLIINGVESSDDLSRLGIDVAEGFSGSDKVYIIDRKGIAKQIKYSEKESLSIVQYIDANDVLRSRENRYKLPK